MDTGATSHLAYNPGNLSYSQPTATTSRIIVGDGSSLPITHVAPFCSLLLPCLYLFIVLSFHHNLSRI